MISIRDSNDFLIEYVSLYNSPRYHIETYSHVNLVVRHLKIWVDLE